MEVLTQSKQYRLYLRPLNVCNPTYLRGTLVDGTFFGNFPVELTKQLLNGLKGCNSSGCLYAVQHTTVSHRPLQPRPVVWICQQLHNLFKAKKKKNMCLWSSQTVSPKLTRPCGFFFFLLVRFVNRGKRSEMVSVVSRYERNEI